MIRLLLILACFPLSDVTAGTIRIGASRTYKTIADGMAVAKNGDTLMVDKGQYREKNLVVKKSITLIGIDYPVLDGEKKYEIVSVTADDVTVSGFRIIHSGISSLRELSGIRVYDGRNINITRNILEDTYFGIYIQAGINCVIADNIIKGFNKKEQQSGNGIHCWKSDSMRIIGNTISGHRDGIYFEFVKNSVIWRNSAKNNIRYGLHFMFSNDDSYVSNFFSNNGSGVSVMFSSRIKMFGNYFKENWGDAAHGILLKEISDGYMQGNHFSKNTSGIFMEGANRIYMKANTFENNGWALKIQASCVDVTLESNIFTGNTFDVGTNGSLAQNTFINNYWDKYDGYDLNHDKIGDIPYRPVSLYSMIVEKNPPAMILFRSFISAMMDKTEKVLPTITPENLKDEKPRMKKPF
jgi:nitrous oxidase accessory protein